MKPGDLVRIKRGFQWSYLSRDGYHNNVGLLVRYESWEKMAEVLVNGELIRIRASHIEKAGKKDLRNSK